jgi:hypothetical protein
LDGKRLIAASRPAALFTPIPVGEKPVNGAVVALS